MEGKRDQFETEEAACEIFCMEHSPLWCRKLTSKQNDMKMIESFEMWVWRRKLQVSWRDRKTNAWIRQRVGVSEEGVLAQLKKRKLFETFETVEGEVEGNARPGGH